MIDGLSHAHWFHTVAAPQLADARRWRPHEVPDILEMIGRVAGPQQRHIAERMLAAAARVEAGGLGLIEMGEDHPPGGWPCDFCAEPDTGLFFPFESFSLDEVLPNGARHVMPSGDRWHVCQRCHDWVEANNWRAIRAWVGPAATAGNTQMLWNGFRINRTGPAIAFTPGTDPAAAR